MRLSTSYQIIMDVLRKAIRWGRSETLVVSLPRKWTIKYGVKEGMNLSLRECPEGLLVAPLHLLEKPALREASVRLVEQDEKTLSILLENYYVDGYDRLILESARSFSEPVSNLLIKIVNQLPGFEIIETTDKRVVVKAVTRLVGDDVLEFVRISSRTTLELIDKLVKGLKSGSDETARIASDIIDEAWRQRGNYLRVQRELRKALSIPPPGLKLEIEDIFDNAHYIVQLSNIYENIYIIAEALTRRQPPPDQAVFAEAALSKIYDNLKKTISAFLQRNKEVVYQVLGEIPLLQLWKRQTETIVDVMKDSVIVQIILEACGTILTINKGIAKTALLLKT